MDYVTYTCIGTRDINEDSFCTFSINETQYFIVADGLGGHGDGQHASILVVSAIEEKIREGVTFQEALDYAQEMLILEQEKYQNQMKSTVAILKVEKKEFLMGHVGDTRIYHFYSNKVKDRTLDHSVPQKFVEAKKIKDVEIRYHPDRNMILRVIGDQWHPPIIEIKKGKIKKKREGFLICSDGFWELIEDEEMLSIFRKDTTASDWLNEMKDIILKNGKDKNMDNFTAVAVIINR